MSTHTITVSFELTDQDIENLIECAGAGISYWAESSRVDTGMQTYTITWEEIQVLGTGQVYTERKRRVLAFAELAEAFAELANQTDGLPYWQMREILEGDLAFDAIVGDIVVQQAIFSEIIFV